MINDRKWHMFNNDRGGRTPIGWDLGGLPQRVMPQNAHFFGAEGPLLRPIAKKHNFWVSFKPEILKNHKILHFLGIFADGLGGRVDPGPGGGLIAFTPKFMPLVPPYYHSISSSMLFVNYLKPNTSDTKSRFLIMVLVSYLLNGKKKFTSLLRSGKNMNPKITCVDQ